MTLIINSLSRAWQFSCLKIKGKTLKKYKTYKRKYFQLLFSRWVYYMTFCIKGIYTKLTQYFQLLQSIVIEAMKNYTQHYHIFINNCTDPQLMVKAELCQRNSLDICLKRSTVQFSTYLWIPLYHVRFTLVLCVFKYLKYPRLVIFSK